MPVKYESGVNPGKAKDKIVKKRLIKRRKELLTNFTHIKWKGPK